MGILGWKESFFSEIAALTDRHNEENGKKRDCLVDKAGRILNLAIRIGAIHIGVDEGE